VESIKRKNGREIIEFDVYGSKSKQAIKKREIFKMSDNETKRMMLENCIKQGKHILNPIIDWLDEDVWEYIESRNLKYCKLYDEGFDRIGCIGCPMAKISRRILEMQRWPKYKINYLKAFQRMIKKNIVDGSDKFVNETPEDVMYWWIYQKQEQDHYDDQIDIFNKGGEGE
jgi:phosphoadenosine phosphosulfate reductase